MKLFKKLTHWLRRKSAPAYLSSAQSLPALDAYRRQRAPTPIELLGELKNTAWSCASINAAACASFAPKLYVSTSNGQPKPRCLTRPIHALTQKRLSSKFAIANCQLSIVNIEEV